MDAEFETRNIRQYLQRIKGRRTLLRISAILWGSLWGLGQAATFTFQAEIIDRLMAVVNRQIVTLGDVEQELRFQKLEPITGDLLGANSSEQQRLTQELAVHRLIEQVLIREQIQQFPGLEIDDEELESQLREIAKKAGGEQKLAEMKIDHQALRERLRWQSQVMRFIDYRFRQFVIVDTKEIEAYYRNDFLPELKKRNASPPPELAEVEERIRQILTEEKLNIQVDEWLASLRKDASIEIFR